MQKQTRMSFPSVPTLLMMTMMMHRERNDFTAEADHRTEPTLTKQREVMVAFCFALLVMLFVCVNVLRRVVHIPG